MTLCQNMVFMIMTTFDYSHVIIFGLHALKEKCQFTTSICNYKIIVTNIYN